MYTGIGASHGIGIGKICVIEEHTLDFNAVIVTDIEAEENRFDAALERFNALTKEYADAIEKRIGTKEAEILNGQIVMMSDPTMAGEMKKMISTGQCAETAVSAVCDMFVNIFSNVEDELMKQRASDVLDIKTRFLKILLGIEEVDIANVPPNTILVAKDFTPSMTAMINKENVAGIITEIGGKTSHSAILARALEIPAVLSVDNITSIAKNDETAIIDGSEGEVYLSPSTDTLNSYIKLKEEDIARKSALKRFIGQPTLTSDGVKREIFCNIGTPKDSSLVLENDGEGIGLFRTEFLFMNNTHIPYEEEQFDAYKAVATAMNGKSVIIRTLDVGGDKEIPYLNMKKEENPFLGFRAIRYCLGNEDMYRIQLRALLRASAYGNIKIMLPLITCVDEVIKAKSLIADIMKELDTENIAYNKDIPVGVMIETPSAVLIADILAKEADFFSIGTNDLTQYTMSVDRGNSDVAYLYSTFQPSVLRAIKHIITCAKNANIPVGMCGEAAADPMMIPLLLAWGLDEFSVNPVFVLSARNIISKISIARAKEIESAVMNMKSEKEIVGFLKTL